MKTTTRPLKHSINRAPCRLALLIPLALACFALFPEARAACQEGCLTNANTVLGDDALILNTTGFQNTAFGSQALLSNTTGLDNTAIGATAMFSNQSGSNNTAIGQTALYSNTNGGGNTATGTGAMYSNTNGISNTATGFEALYRNTEGQYNTATGNGALAQNSTGNFNTASGASALVLNTTGGNNTAIGVTALASNTTGSKNTAIGFNALLNNTNGNNNIALGSNAGFNLAFDSDNIAIGNPGVAGQSNAIRIGKRGTHNATFIAGISGAPAAGGVGVIIGSNGKLGTILSSERFKDNIQPMDKASEAILALKPVTFRYKHELDPDGIPQFGLVAEDVEKVNPDLVVRDAEGKVNTVRYEAVNAMLLNEFLKEHQTVQEQGATITRQRKDFEAAFEQQQKQIETLTAMVKQQASQIQKVSTQLELSKPAPQTVKNNN